MCPICSYIFLRSRDICTWKVLCSYFSLCSLLMPFVSFTFAIKILAGLHVSSEDGEGKWSELIKRIFIRSSLSLEGRQETPPPERQGSTLTTPDTRPLSHMHEGIVQHYIRLAKRHKLGASPQQGEALQLGLKVTHAKK